VGPKNSRALPENETLNGADVDMNRDVAADLNSLERGYREVK
jgi:hypothetical protein